MLGISEHARLKQKTLKEIIWKCENGEKQSTLLLKPHLLRASFRSSRALRYHVKPYKL